MLLVSLLFIQCFSVHFVWEFPSTMPVFRNECNITDSSFPGVWWAGGGPSTAALFFISWESGGLRGSPTLLPQSSGFKNQAAGQSPGEAEMGRMLALRPDTRDNTELICISHHSLRSPSNLLPRNSKQNCLLHLCSAWKGCILEQNKHQRVKAGPS